MDHAAKGSPYAGDSYSSNITQSWLEETENGNLKELLVPYPADQMRMWEISPRVNSAGERRSIALEIPYRAETSESAVN